MAGMSFAEWVLRRKGVRGLWHVVGLVLVWSAAEASGALDGKVESGERTYAVCRFAERTSWGSESKFYREVKYWRALTGLESPEPLLEAVRRRRGDPFVKDRGQALAQLATVPASALGLSAA